MRAATLVVTYPTPSGLRVVLTRRPLNLRRHPGQVSFPGGMIEPTDASPLEAALREAWEEVGLELPSDPPAVELSIVETLTSGIVIQPFWIALSHRPRLVARPSEVDAILRIPLRSLQLPGVFQQIVHPRAPGQLTGAYVWRNEVIWGATAQTLTELLSLCAVSHQDRVP